MTNINEFGIVRDKSVEDFYWDCLKDWADETITDLMDSSYGDFDEYQEELENYFGVITVIQIDKTDLDNKSFDSNQEYEESLETVVDKDKLSKIFKVINTRKEWFSTSDVPEDEIAVLLFTDEWDFITYYGLHKEETPDEDEFDSRT
ncbi:MAG: hypothetical protein HOM19_02005 [Candidatus Marinimicrobia bacterium]|jgi:hypothetical protein|nr:hypothetical protein [Candidatus Neomarinimicrobiota bacterium]